MRTEAYVKDDIKNILSALRQSIESLPANDYPEDLYRMGFMAALQSVGLAFGIEGVAEARLPVTTLAYSTTEPK